MEDEGDEAPLAVQIDGPIEASSQNQLKSSPPKDGDVAVGVTVITGYLGAGKSTVSSYPKPYVCFLEVRTHLYDFHVLYFLYYFY